MAGYSRVEIIVRIHHPAGGTALPVWVVLKPPDYLPDLAPMIPARQFLCPYLFRNQPEKYTHRYDSKPCWFPWQKNPCFYSGKSI